MVITEERAFDLVYALHDAWNRRDMEALMAVYAEDVSFWANVGAPDGGPLVMNGKAAFRQFFMVWKDFECLSVPQNLRFDKGVCRCNVEFFIRDPRTGLQHASTYRQMASYRGDVIARLEQYHDAKAMAAYMSILAGGEQS